MNSVLDVAQYIIEKQGPMTAMKLQKLVYYCQAWSLVWEEEPLFAEKIQAWANGPVVRELFEKHKGQFTVGGIDGSNVGNLTAKQKETIDAVLKYYGNYTAQYLSDLSHMEGPWKEARQGIADGINSETEITLATMHEYYSSIPLSDINTHVK